MKKLVLSGLAGMFALFLFPGCEKNNFAIDKEPIVPSFAKFNFRNNADTTGTYYIKSTGEPFKIPIALTSVSDKDRTIQLCYSSSTGAVAGTHYNAPTSIVIPAGKVADSLSIHGLFTGYPTSSRVDTLRIRICGSDVPGQDLRNNFRLVLRKYCDVTVTDFDGAWNNTMDGTYGPYPMTFTAGPSNPSTGVPNSDTVTVTNLWDPGVPVTTKVVLNWTNPANFTTTIPDQVYYAAANWWVRQQPGTTGTFSSCEPKTIKLVYQLYNKTTGAILYNNQVTDMKR